MNILFHTIALEPARWTPQRVANPLLGLLAPIADAGFTDLEIFELHLNANATEIRDSLAKHGLKPIILSSYLNLNPATTADAELAQKIDELAGRVDYYGFSKIRLFPGGKMSPADKEGISIFTKRLRQVMERVPDAEILLETHDHSLADDATVPVKIVEEIGSPKLGLLYQPAFFTVEEALAQFETQKHVIRHVHLQNRNQDGSFATLREGIFPWQKMLPQLSAGVDATIEFVPVGICPAEKFDLQASLKQAREERDYVRTIV